MEKPPRPSIWEHRVLEPEAVLLTDRIALVTGAAQGIGEATALGLARFGADVALCDRDAEGLASTEGAVRDLGRRCTSGVFDVRDAQAVSAFLEDVRQSFGHLDVLVNNAGGGFAARFVDVSAKGEDALVRENFASVTGMIRAAAPLLRAGGSIVNVTSVEAHRAGPMFAIYSAMKAAVANLTMSLALELGGRAIRVNCVAPDMIPTPGDQGLEEASGTAGLPVARHAWPEEGSVHDCAAAIVFLASDLSRFVTGTTLHVDGGTWAAGGWKLRPDGSFAL